jgi:rhodanese-related sulfurtransferase
MSTREVTVLRRIIRRLRKGAAPDVAPVRPAPSPAPHVPEEEPEPVAELEVDTEQLKAWISDDVPFTLVDIREPHELRLGYAASALLLRMNDIPNRVDELPSKDTRLVIYCAAGSRSYGVAHWLREQGWEDSWSLESGFYGVTEAGMDVARPDGE